MSAGKRLLCGIMVSLIIICVLPISAYALQGDIPVKSAEVPAEIERLFDATLLIERNTDTVLYAKDDERTFTPIGGAVNLMTAYIVMQETDPDQEIPVIDGVNSLSSKDE